MIAADEFKEDIQTGDEVRIVTQTEQFEGRVTRIRTTTIKLETAGTEQTISFDAMLSYARISTHQESAVGREAPQALTLSPIAAALAPYWEAAVGATFPKGNRACWKRLKKKVPEYDHAKETSIFSQLDYAVKVHEDGEDANRMRDILAAARRLTLMDPGNKSAHYLLGILQEHVCAWEDAARSFGLSGAYEEACASAVHAGEESLLYRYALLAAGKQGSLAAFRCLRENASLFFAAAHEFLQHSVDVGEDVKKRVVGVIAYQAARAGRLPAFSAENVLLDANIKALCRAVDAMDREADAFRDAQAYLDAQQAEIAAKGKKLRAKTQLPAGLPNREYMEGCITQFHTDRLFGTVRSDKYPSVFFHIYQVNDRALRKDLLDGNSKQKVMFCLGSNQKTMETGAPAGDDIRPAEPLEEKAKDKREGASAPAAQEGVVVRYSWMDGKGVVRLDDGTVRGFQERNVSDRRLLEYLSSYYKANDEWPVRFHLAKVGEREHAEHIETASEFPEDVLTDWRISKTFEREEIAEKQEEAAKPTSLRTEEQEEDILSRPFAPLAPFEPAAAGTERKSAPVVRSVQHRAPVRSVWSGTFEIASSPASADYLPNYAKAHKILSSKEPDAAHLKRAETYCIQALKRGENIEGTVGDLLHLYLRKSKLDERPEEDYDKAFDLMEAARDHLPHDKYVQQMINLLAASNRDPERLIALYEENINDFIPTGRKLHFLMQKAGLEFRLEKYEDVMDSCSRWRQIARTSFPQPNDIAYHSIDRYEAMALYSLGRVEEAKAKAHDVTEYFPQDESLQSILSGNWDPQSGKESDYGFVNLFENLSGTLPAYIEDYLNGLSLSDMKETRYVKDAGIVAPKADADALEMEYAQIEKHGRSVVPKEKAKWQFLLAKYILICLASWPKIHPSEPLSSPKLNETALKLAVRRGLTSLIKAERDKPQEEQQLDTIRFYHRLILEILHGLPNNEKDIENEICSYVYTYFYKGTQIATMETKELTADRMITTMERIQPRDPRREMRIGLTQLLDQPYARGEKDKIERILFHSSAFKEEDDETDESVEKAFREEARAQKEMSDNFPATIAQDMDNFGSLVALQQLKAYFDEQMIHMTKQDQYYSKRLLEDIFPGLDRICSHVNFATHESSLGSVESNAENLQKEITEAPTQFSYEKLLPMLKLVGDYVRAGRQILYRKSPDISKKVLEHNRKEDGGVSVTIEIDNVLGCQPADNAEIVVSLGKREIAHENTVLRDQYQMQFDIPKEALVSEGNGEELQTADLLVEIHYQCKAYTDDGKLELEAKEFSEPEPLPLGDAKDFHPIKNLYSPYTQGKAVEDEDMVFGRDKEIQRIIGKIEAKDGCLMPGRAIVIYGQKRTGKSTVLVQLRKQIERHFGRNAICIDLGSIGVDVPRKDNPRQFLANFLSHVAMSLDIFVDGEEYKDFTAMMYDADIDCPCDTLPMSANPTGDFNTYLASYLKVVKRWNPHANIVFFLDEFTWLHQFIKEGSADPSFLRFWKALTETHKCLSIIVGQNHMPQFISAYPNDFGAYEKRVISYIDKDAVALMIREPLRRVEPAAKIDEDAVERMYQASGGSAFYQMLLCSWLVEYMNERCVYRVTKGVVEAMIAEAIEERRISEEDLFQPLVADPKDEVLLKELLISLARNDENAKGIPEERFANETEALKSRKSELLDLLFQRDVLKREKSLYKIRIGFVHQWIVQSYGGK